MSKCNDCEATESEVAILFDVICAKCYSSLSQESRCQVIRMAAHRLVTKQIEESKQKYADAFEEKRAK